jgi:DNA repair protein RadC
MKTLTQTNIPLIKLTYSNPVKKADRKKISCYKDSVEALRSVFDNETIDYLEQSYMLCLNRGNHLLGVYPLSVGGMAGTVMDLKVIASAALLTGSHGVVLSHNHPSGNTKPSHADIQLTKKVKQALQTLDITLLDHIILTRESELSFAEEGLI